MAYEKFEDLPVWQSAARLYDSCEDLLNAAPPRLSRSFRDQLERSVLSVSSNIAEVFERGTAEDLVPFIYRALGSAGEVRSMLRILARRSYMDGLEQEMFHLISLVETCSRQLRDWVEICQGPGARGFHLMDETSRHEGLGGADRVAGDKIFDEVQNKLIARLPAAHQLRKEWERKHGPVK